MYEVLYQEGPKESYHELTGIIAKEAAAWRTVQLAGGLGKVLAASATPPETPERDLAVQRVENSLDEISIHSRVVEELREAGLPEEVLTKIDGDLRAVTGGNVPGQSKKGPGI